MSASDDPRKSIASESVLSLIVSCTREVLPELNEYPFSPNDSLVDLGANSIDRAEIIMMVLERLQLRIARTEVHGPRNIGELSDLLVQKLGA